MWELLLEMEEMAGKCGTLRQGPEYRKPSTMRCEPDPELAWEDPVDALEPVGVQVPLPELVCKMASVGVLVDLCPPPAPETGTPVAYALDHLGG